MTNKNQKIIRIVLTGLVLLIGGYFIQGSNLEKNIVDNAIDSANADAIGCAGCTGL